jgi:hypothetical protein
MRRGHLGGFLKLAVNSKNQAETLFYFSTKIAAKPLIQEVPIKFLTPLKKIFMIHLMTHSFFSHLSVT